MFSSTPLGWPNDATLKKIVFHKKIPIDVKIAQ